MTTEQELTIKLVNYHEAAVFVDANPKISRNIPISSIRYGNGKSTTTTTDRTAR